MWAFLGDGEMDEPETMGATALAGREQLDNLIWVVNCNLQRLDGPVRGNGKIIQELEADFRGAGWNVIKVVWGSRWDPLLAADTDGRLVKVMEECVDGEYQTYKSRDGAYVREHFFGKDPVLLERVSHMSDEEIWLLNRGGLDQQKVYAAYHEAVQHTGQPTVILAKTIKGYGMGVSGEGQMITHQAKKMTEDALLAFRDRFELPLSDEQVRAAEYYKPPEDSAGDAVPARAPRRARRQPAGPPAEGRRAARGARSSSCSRVSSRAPASARSRPRWRSSACSRRCCATSRSAAGSSRSSPTSRARSGWRACSARSGSTRRSGQLYQPQDSEQLMFYKEDKHGQILEEGITEAGSISSFIAAGTSYSAHGEQMVPFYIYYSMFGYQRVGDLVWAAADSRTRGFMLGGTAGRTTLNGEGLQHEDGHSHVLFSVVPELPRLRPDVRLRGRGDHPGRPAADGRRAGGRLLLPHADERELPPPGDARGRGATGILRGMYLLREGSVGGTKKVPRVQLLGSGTILQRGPGRRRAARVRLRRRRRRVERDLVHRAAPRRDRGRAVEHAPSARRSRAART